MARPIPLTADPDNPASPAGAIPVDLFGVEGGGGGARTAVATIPLTPPGEGGAVDATEPMALEYVKATRIGNVVQLQVLLRLGDEDEEGSIGTGGSGGVIGQVPEGFRPLKEDVFGTPFALGSPVSGTIKDTESAFTGGAVQVAGPNGDITSSLNPSSDLKAFQASATYLTDDPFPEG